MINGFNKRRPWPRRRYLILTLLTIQILSLVSSAMGAGYKGFTKLNPNECLPVDKKVISQLPSEWQRYTGYVKICNLKHDHEKSNISIISVWVDDFLEAKFPHPAPHKWENFPLPLIVSTELWNIGTLPEIYPVDDITSPTIYYGRWQYSIPTEIRVDVKNPAEGGDYYYAPLIYNRKSGRYEMKDKEISDGRRP